MSIVHHKFSSEFPEHKQAIHDLKVSDSRFALMMKEYDELDDEIYRIEEGIETPSDEYTETLKMERVNLKDLLHAILMASVKGHN